jgi:predicted enzyme related to lactoylglutathione lyase
VAPEEATCGTGIASNAVLPASLAGLMASMATVLEVHQKALDPADAGSRPEIEAYQRVVQGLRDSADRLQAAAKDMAASRTVPMGKHDDEALSGRRALDAFADFVRAKQQLLGLLQETVEHDQRMLAEMEGSGGKAPVELARVILFVKDLPSMIRFHGEVLGLAGVPESRSETWAEFKVGSATLGLHAIPAHLAEGIVIEDPPERRESTPLKLAFQVPDVAAERERLVSLGVAMDQLRPWGACDGLDPEGNVFQIVQPKS